MIVNLDLMSLVQGAPPRRLGQFELPEIPLPGEPFIFDGAPLWVLSRGFHLTADGHFEAGLLLAPVRPGQG